MLFKSQKRLHILSNCQTFLVALKPVCTSDINTINVSPFWRSKFVNPHLPEPNMVVTSPSWYLYLWLWRPSMPPGHLKHWNNVAEVVTLALLFHTTAFGYIGALWRPKHDGRLTASLSERLALSWKNSLRTLFPHLGLFEAFILTASWQGFYLPELQQEVWSLFSRVVQ